MTQYTVDRLRNNNFDLLRFVFAGVVGLVHAYDLSGFQQLAWIPRIFSSAIAVKSFFIVSGFLIFMSYENSKSLSIYAVKRIRRIYPAYFTVVMLFAFILIAVSSNRTADYFSSQWLKYVTSNLVFLNFLQPGLPGVFDSNHLSAVNGALWTLKIEVMFYFSVPALAYLFQKFSKITVITFFYLASVAYAGLFLEMGERTGASIYDEISRQLPGQFSYFMAGAALYYYLPIFEKNRKNFLLFGIVITAINVLAPVFSLTSLKILEPIALAVVVIYVGLFLYLGNFGKYGDFSYGIYIIHFPILQLLLYSGWFNESPWYFVATGALLTTAGAVLLWHGIEKRFQYRGHHGLYRAQASAA